MLIIYMAQSLIIGCLVGLLVSTYRFALDQAESFAFYYFGHLEHNFMLLPVLVIAFFLVGRISLYLMEKTPEIAGGGILYVQHALREIATNNSPWLILLNKFLAGVLAIACGLFLGKVGPSLQLGVCLGQGINKLLNADENRQLDRLATASSASLSAAMSAPLAGLTYNFEGLLEHFSWRRLLFCLPGTLAAYLVSLTIFGDKPIIPMQAFNIFKVQELLQLVVLGCIIGLIGFIFGRLMVAAHMIYAKYVAQNVRPFIPLALALLFAIYFPAILGTGHTTLALIDFNRGLEFLLILLVLKSLFFLVAFASGTSGGMFFPTLIIGSLLGAVIAEVAIAYLGVAEVFFINIVLVSMAGFFAAVLSAPLTAVVLVCELTLSVNNLVPILIICPIAHYLNKGLRGMYAKLQTNNSL